MDQDTPGSGAFCSASDFVWTFLTVITVKCKFVPGWQKYVMMAYNVDGRCNVVTNTTRHVISLGGIIKRSCIAAITPSMLAGCGLK